MLAFSPPADIMAAEVKHMLSENIKRLRAESGMSQEELAARLAVVRQTVSKWERGVSRS